MNTWVCTGDKGCDGTCERVDPVEGPDGESTPKTEAQLAGEEKCSTDGPPVRVHVEQTILRGPNAGTHIRTFLVRRVVSHECWEVPQKRSEPKPLSAVGLTEAVLKAAARGPAAVRALCAGTDDGRLALFTEQFAPTRVVVGSKHNQDRARVYAALRGEMFRRKERRSSEAARGPSRAVSAGLGAHEARSGGVPKNSVPLVRVTLDRRSIRN